MRKHFIIAAIAAQLIAAPALAPALAQAPNPPPINVRPASTLLSAPSRVISNGVVTARVYLPGKPNSFYRGTRFDHFGTVGSLTYKGQEFYGFWFDKIADNIGDYAYNDQNEVITGPDSADVGPVEEYLRGLGFDEAKPGGTFIKIGVGVLRKDDAPYSQFKNYQILDTGKIATSAKRDSITFTQTLRDKATGYAYVYTKTLQLVPNAPKMTIAHTLKNIGAKPIRSSVYNHNFVVIDPGGANIELRVPFDIVPPPDGRAPPADLLQYGQRTLTFLRELGPRERVLTPIAREAPHAFTVINRRTGVSVAVEGDRPLQRVGIFAVRSTFAVEPFVDIQLAPGETQSWAQTYTYGVGEK